MTTNNTYHIGIIGVGPKGLYALERLCAEIKAQACSQATCIHLFNENRFFGAGNNYRDDQAEYLLINFNIGYINMWSEDTPAPVVPRPLNLTQWLQEQGRAYLDECAIVSRADTGRYLQWGLRQIIAHRPANVKIKLHQGKVSNLTITDRGWQVQWKQKQEGEMVTKNQFSHELLLTTGHPRHQPDEQDLTYLAQQKRCPQAHYIPFVYPVAERLALVPAQSIVAIKGMGLTFTDSVLELTEGRGGNFELTIDGNYRYYPSGQEPQKIYPFSRSGLPMIPRGKTYNSPPRKLHFFRKEKFIQLARQKKVLDWETDFLPLLALEVKAAYYKCLLQETVFALPEQLTSASLEEYIHRYHQAFPNQQVFKLAILLDPFPNHEELEHRTVVNYFNYLTEAARTGEEKHPLAAAASVWRYASSIFAHFYRFGGLSPASQRVFLHSYAGQLNRTTYGLPIQNALKLLALADAGILDFTYSRGAKVETVEGAAFRFIRPNTEKGTDFQVLLDARIPKTSLVKDASPLYANLLEQGLIKPYKNSQTENKDDGFEPGCLAISIKGQVINKTGQVIPSLAATGIPTEGITFDNDTLSTHKNNFAPAWAKRVVHQINQLDSCLV